ncbi:utrophin-like isoform X4 [Xenia sp. Carnegie-2017]|uniref:utrophin-like isoform X4 n=1 Tax=Xenia sp. Carnegie-2017 TaxID=2897299 RepID=UPI001F04712F|nr:utrophin-like isoform X4 [Xenia sp. Carnegie-2017]
MEPQDITETIRTRTDEREVSNIRTFTKWINSKLSEVQPKVEITDLFEDLRNGHVLLTLLEVLKNKRLPRERGRLRIHHVSNLEIVIKTMENDNIKLHGISAQAIADGIHKSTLGLVWSIILHYQVHGAMTGESFELETRSNVSAGGGSSSKKKLKPSKEAAVEDKLLHWVQNAIDGYDDLINVKDLTKSWSDGRAFNVLIHVHRNDLIDLEEVEKMSNDGRLENAFSVAEDHLNVQKLLEPSDVNQKNPDKKLVMMYLSSLYQSLHHYEHVKRGKRRKVEEEDLVVSQSVDVESSIPEMPSDAFLKFKDNLSETSAKLQSLEDSLLHLEDDFKNRGDVDLWEKFKLEYEVVENEMNQLNDVGLKVTNDNNVLSSEKDEIRSDLKAIEIRWTSIGKNTAKLDQRMAIFRRDAGEWRKQAGVFLDWMDDMDKKFDAIEEIKSEDDISELDRHADALKNMVQLINDDPTARKTLEFGRELIKSDALSRKDQVKVKEQLMVMEKDFNDLKARAENDVQRFNSSIKILKETQSSTITKWRKEAETMRNWLVNIENQLEPLSRPDVKKDIKNIKANFEKCEVLLETLKNDHQPQSIVEYGEMLMDEKALSKEQKLKMKKQLNEMKGEWNSLTAKCSKLKHQLKTARDQSEMEGKNKVEEWNTNFELLLRQMTEVKSSIRKVKSLPVVEERSRAFKDCEKVADNIRADYENALECAEEVISREDCPEWERSQINEDADVLKKSWNDVMTLMSEESDSIDGLMSTTSDDYRDKVNEWFQKYAEMDKLLQTIAPKVEGNFTMGDTLPVVEEQIAEQEDLLNEVANVHESVEYLLVSGEEAIKNPVTPKPDKNKLKKDIANLLERWESFNHIVNSRLQRLEDMKKHLQENFQNKMNEFSDKANSFEGWLTREEKKFQAMGVVAPNLEAAMKQKPKIEAMMKEMKQEEKKMRNMIRLGEEIQADSALSEENNLKLGQELNALKNRWKSLEEKINWRMQRLNETISKLESQQQDKLEKWQENASQISDWLDKAQLRLAERGAIGSDLKTVNAQKDEFQGFLQESLDFQRNIYNFTVFSNNLQADPCVSEGERSKVQQKTKSLNDRWDTIVKQINNHHNALEEQLDDLEDKHKSDLFGHWQDKFSAFSDWLANTENAVEGLKDIADNVLLVQEQQVETQELISELTSKEPDINEVFSIAQTVSDDPLIEDNEASSIEKQANELSGRWVALNETLKGRSNSLQIRGVVLNKEEQQLLHEWHRNVEPFNSWLSKVEDDGSMIVDDSVDVNAIKDYSIRVKTLESEIQGRKPVLEEIVKLGEQLLSNTVVRDEEKVHIAEEMEIFEDRWSKLNVKIHENNKWADMKLMELAKKERESLDVWRRNVDPFIVWLEETQGKLDAIQETSTELENLKEKHLALQSIKQDVMGHEEALARIIAIVGKLTKDENVSETEKMNVKAEMSRLQEKWNRAQNNVHLKYLSVTESLMELAQKEKLTLEEWKKLTDPFKEWLVEAKGRFENLQHEKGYDAALINQEKLTALSQEINDHELNYENIAQLKDTIIQDEHLSVSFKDNIRNEADTLGTKWFELKDNVASQGESVQSQIVFLDVSQRDQLERWRFKSQALRDKHVKVKSDLLEFENMALNLDGLKKKFTDLKKTDDEIKENRSEMETVSAFASEIFNDPNVVKNEKSRVKSEADSMDEQQGEQEKMSSEYHRRLEEKIQEKEGLQSSKYENWKIATQPLHEWLDGIEEDAKDMDTIGSNIADVQKQCDGLEKLSNEFKDGESDLFNILNMGEELSIDSQLSEDVRTTVRQDISSLKENHSNIADLLKSQREKMKSHYMKLQQHQEKSLIDWNERKTSLDARIKTMDKRTGQWPTIGNTMHEVESQNAIVKAIETDLESMEWELNTVSEFGESLCEDVSILDAKKETVREEMTTMKNAFDNCQKNVVDRKSRLEAKLEELQNAHKSELLAKWEMSLFKTSSWIEICEDSLDFDEEDQKTLSDVRKRMDEIDDLLDSVDGYKDQYDSTLDCGELVLKEPSIESNEKEKVEKDLISLKERWRAIGQNIESIVSRLEKQESSFSDELQVRLAKWRQEYEVTMLWREEEKMKLEEMEKDQDEMGYDRVYESTKILEEMLEMLPLYENKVDSLTEKSDFLVQNSNEREARQISNDMQALKSNIGSLKIKIESMKSSFVAKVREFDNIHGSKYSDWSRKDEKIERKISNIEEKWKEIKFLENSNEEEVIQHRVQLEDVVADINNLQPDFDRHCSLGHQLSKEPALNSELRTSIEDKVASHENRWKSFGICKKIYMLLPRIEVIEPIVKVEERQVESMADMTAFDDLFGSDSDRELKQWYQRRLYARLIEGLNQLLSSSIHTFEEVETTVSLTTLSDDFDTATEQMDGAKNVAESVSKLEAIATENLELASKITTCGILILNEEDKVEVDEKIKKLKEWANEITGKARSEFNRSLFDDYLVLFRKEIDERKAWITNSENRMSLNYLEIATLEGFEEALTEHKQFEEELSQKNMAKMVDASDRVPELENNHKVDVKNLERRWKILKQWSDEYSLGLRTIIKEWKEISRDQDLVIQWLDPNEEKLSKICEKIHWANVEALKKQIQDLKNIQSKLEDNGLLLSNSHVKGMMLMKFLSDEAAASKAIDNDLSQLDRRWNKMAKDIIARIELLRNIQFKQADIVDKKRRVNTYIDETNSDLDEHETKTQRLRGNVSDEMENGETEKERKTRLKKEKEDMQEDVIKLVKSLEEKISMFANYQTLVDRINHASKELEDVADDESKLELHDDLANFNARWQVIVTRLEEYSDNDLPDSSMLGCMGFVKRKFSSSTF